MRGELQTIAMNFKMSVTLNRLFIELTRLEKTNLIQYVLKSKLEIWNQQSSSIDHILLSQIA
jgi:hypothetical protein